MERRISLQSTVSQHLKVAGNGGPGEDGSRRSAVAYEEDREVHRRNSRRHRRVLRNCARPGDTIRTGPLAEKRPRVSAESGSVFQTGQSVAPYVAGHRPRSEAAASSGRPSSLVIAKLILVLGPISAMGDASADRRTRSADWRLRCWWPPVHAGDRHKRRPHRPAGLNHCQAMRFLPASAQHAAQALALKTFKHMHELSLRFISSAHRRACHASIERGVKDANPSSLHDSQQGSPDILEFALVAVIFAFAYGWNLRDHHCRNPVALKTPGSTRQGERLRASPSAANE